MAASTKEYSNNISVPVEQVARLIHTFNRQQKAKLLQLVPELQTIRPEEADIPIDQVELMAYFQKKIDILPQQVPLQDDDPFVGGLTVAEFFALPETDQSRVWQEAYLEAEHKLKNYEHPVQHDALPAR